MSIEKAVSIGIGCNELSKKVMGTDEVSAERTLVAVTAGTATGAMVGGGMAVLSLASAPVTLPLCVGAGLCAGIASLFES